MNRFERECREFARERKPAGIFLANGGSVKKTTIASLPRHFVSTVRFPVPILSNRRVPAAKDCGSGSAELTGKFMMSRVMTLGALTFSLFLLGLFAGGGISPGRTSPVVEPEQLVASPELAVPQMPAFDAGDLISAG